MRFRGFALCWDFTGRVLGPGLPVKLRSVFCRASFLRIGVVCRVEKPLSYLKLSQAMSKKARNRRSPSLDQAIWDIASWTETRQGRLLLASERRVLKQVLPDLFGYHLLQLSMTPERDNTNYSRINHCFGFVGSAFEYAWVKKKWEEDAVESLRAAVRAEDANTNPDSRETPPAADNEQTSPEGELIVSGVANWASLPLADESIDVCLLHHALEYTDSSQQILKEVARVLRPRGHVIILGFNPYSWMGFVSKCKRLVSTNRFLNRRSLTQGRLEDWLDFLDFSVHQAIPVRTTIRQRLGLITRPRSRTQRGIRESLELLWSLRPFAAGFCLVGCKDRIGAIPRPMRETEPSSSPAPVMETAPLREPTAASTANR